MIKKITNSNFLIKVIVLLLCFGSINLSNFAFAEEIKVTTEPFSPDSTEIYATGKANATYGIFANGTYSEFLSDETGNFTINLASPVQQSLSLYEVNSLGAIGAVNEGTSISPTLPSVVSPPLYLGKNERDEMVFYSFNSMVYVKIDEEVFSGPEYVVVPTPASSSIVKAYSSKYNYNSQVNIIDPNKPEDFPFQLTESPEDKFRLIGTTVPGLKVGIHFENNLYKYVTTADENGLFFLQLKKDDFILRSSAPTITYTLTLNSQKVFPFSKYHEKKIAPPTHEVASINNIFEVVPPVLGSRYIEGKTTPYNFINAYVDNSGIATFSLTERAEEDGTFRIRIPKAQYGDRYSLYPDDFYGHKEFVVPDVRPIQQPTYIITDNEVRVLLSHPKTTYPFAKLDIETKNDMFYSLSPNSTNINEELHQYEYIFRDVPLQNEDQIKITIFDDVAPSVSVRDTIVGHEVKLPTLMDHERLISGVTSPFVNLSTDTSDIGTVSDENGYFELRFDPSASIPTKLNVSNKNNTQRYTIPLQFEDVTAPSVRSHKYMTDTLFLTFNEKDVSIQLKTYDALGKVIQTEEERTDTTEHIFHMLSHPNEISKVELVLTDAKGNVSRPITLDIPRNNVPISIATPLEGQPYVSIWNGRVGDTIVVEHDGKSYEHVNVDWSKPAQIAIPNITSGDQLTAFIKGTSNKVTAYVQSNKINQSISPDRKHVSFVYSPGPGQYVDIFYQWILIDENRIEYSMPEEKTMSYKNTPIYFPIGLPKNHSVRLIVKSATGETFYDMTKQFDSPDMPANPLNISWTDQTSQLELTIGGMPTIEAWHKGQKQFTTVANYEGKVRHTLPTALKAGDVWTFVIKTSSGISYSHDVVVKDATPPRLLSLEIPRNAQQDYVGAVEPGTNIYISTPNGDKLYKPDTKGSFVIPAKDYDFNQEHLYMMLRDDSKIETQIQVPRKLETEPVIAGSIVLRGQTIRNALVTAHINGSYYSATTTYDGHFEITVPTGVPHTKIKWTVTADHQSYTFPEENVFGKLDKFMTEPFLPTHSFIKGKMTAGTKIEATVAGKLIGTSTASSDGIFSIQVPKQVAGTVVTLRGSRLGYQSETTNVRTLNLFPTWSLGAIDSADSYISGKGLVGSYAQAYANGRTISSKVKIGSSGTFKLTIPKQKGGTYIIVKLERSGYASSEKKSKVLFNFTGHTVNSVTRKMTTLTGKGTSGSVMTAYVGNRKIGTSVKVSSKGTYQIRIPLQKAGTKITVKQTKSGYVTSAKTTTVLNVFSKLTVNPVTRSHTYVSGAAEKTATVLAYVGSKAISKKATVNSKGQYRLTIPKQKTGTTVKIVLQKSGYQSMSKTIKVK